MMNAKVIYVIMEIVHHQRKILMKHAHQMMNVQATIATITATDVFQI